MSGACAAGDNSKVARAQQELWQMQKALGEKAVANARASALPCGASGVGVGVGGVGGVGGGSGGGEGTRSDRRRTVERDRRRLFIGNLPLELNEADAHKARCCSPSIRTLRTD